MKYLTDLEALNYHGYDWHSFAFEKERKYPREVREWAGDYGIEKRGEREIASPIRAFLDHLFYTIRFMKLVPTYRIEDLLFSDEEEKEILQKVEELLEPVLNDEERELLHRWKRFNAGGNYEPVNRLLSQREAWREKFRKNRSNGGDFRERLRKAFGL